MTDYLTQDLPDGEVTSIGNNDIVMITRDPSGTPIDYYIKIANILGQIITGAKLVWNSTTSISVNTGSFFTESGDYINITTTLTLSSLSLSASTFYHVYGYLSGGVAAIEAVTTAPVAWKGTAYSKTGDTSRRYLGTILSDASSNVYSFEHMINRMVYKLYRSTAAPFLVLSAGTSTSAASIDLSGVVPVTARLATCRFFQTADKVVSVSENNSVASTQNTVRIAASSVAYVVQDVAMDTNNDIWYIYDSAVGSGSLTVYVVGYHFDR